MSEEKEYKELVIQGTVYKTTFTNTSLLTVITAVVSLLVINTEQPPDLASIVQVTCELSMYMLAPALLLDCNKILFIKKSRIHALNLILIMTVIIIHISQICIL